MEEKMFVLFVCTGNTCRSVMARGIFQQLWNRQESVPYNIKAFSAGIMAREGAPPTREALLIMQENGIDLSLHLSQQISLPLIERASFIFTMTADQKKAVLQDFPQAAGKLWQLKEYACGSSAGDITDPFGGVMEQYRQTAEEIKTALKKTIKRLKSSFSDQNKQGEGDNGVKREVL